MKLLIHPPGNDALLSKIRDISSDIEIVNAESEDDAKSGIVDADAFFGRISPDVFSHARKLKWVHAPLAGLENYIFQALRDSNLVLTNTRGIFSDYIADHAIAFILCFAREFHRHFRNQLLGKWERSAQVVHLSDCTLGVIGLGGIGKGVASRGLGHEMRVIAVDAVPRPMDRVEVWTEDRLDDLLAQSDFVVSCVPHTPKTEKLIGEKELARMKPTAYLINVGRGVVVDMQALTNALTHGRIAGAGLDVYEVEPLPENHPLWRMENVILTPHTAGESPHYEERREKVFLENLRRYVKGDPLVNVVDKSKWYATSGELPETR